MLITKMDTPETTETFTSNRRERQYEAYPSRKFKYVTTTSTYTNTFQEFQVTLDGETRIIRGNKGWGEPENGVVRYYLRDAFSFHVGRTGQKLHRGGVTIEVQPDGKIVVFNHVVLNRQASLVGFWKPEYDAPTARGSKHIGTFKKEGGR